MIVVDSCVLAVRNLTATLTPLAEKLEQVDNLWIAPPLWRYEFQNILAKRLWAGQFSKVSALRVWQNVSARMQFNECEPSPERVIELSMDYRITAYDANFIALAIEMGIPCVTEDRELREKFPAIAFRIADFLMLDRRGGEAREPRAPYQTRRNRKTSACPP